jgi:Lon-like protease
VLNWYRRRSLLARRFLVSASLLLVLISLLWFTPTRLYVTAPGAAIRTEQLVRVPGGRENPGRLMLLVVAAQPANLFWYLYARVDPRVELETRRQFLGTIPNYREYVRLNRLEMADSQQTAMAVALQVLGLGAGVTPEGVHVVSLQPGAPAAAYLQPDDILLAVTGTAVRSVEQLREQMRAVEPGAAVDLTVQRAGGVQSLRVPTYEDPDRPGQALIGAIIKTTYHFDIPVPIQIKAGSITGPSAGLIFALTIIDKLTEGGIKGGLSVAGTGTILPDGRVGPVGGVAQKVFTAEAAGAQVLFVPRSGYAEAAAAATRITVVPVDTIHDALDWLRARTPQR